MFKAVAFYALSLSFLSVSIHSYAQETDITDAIVAEGKKIYRSEMASWHGTDIFLEKYKDQRSNIGGYFSYADGDVTKCLFFSKGDSPSILATITFDSTFETTSAILDHDRKEFTDKEKQLFLIRKIALETINKDTLFKTYDGTSLNLVPLADGDGKKVYVLTGPRQGGVIIFGNDYLLSFDDNNKLTGTKRLHKNILPVEYGKMAKEGQRAVAGIHNHLPETGDYITPTDIATLMLYEKMAGWEHYYVMSENYVSIWNCHKDELVTLTKEAWERIYADKSGSKKQRRKRR